MGAQYLQYQEHYPPQQNTSSQQHSYETWGSGNSSTYQPSGAAPVSRQSRIIGCLSYASFWLSGLVFLIYARQKNDRYVRFHALQSIIYFGVLFLLTQAIGLAFAMQISIIPSITIPLLDIIAVISWAYALVQAYRGTYVKLPLVGDLIIRYLPGNAPTERPK